MAKTAKASNGVLTEEQALELIAYLVSAADSLLTEPSHYGNFRLIDATSRLIGMMLEHETPRTGAFLRAFKEEVDKKKVWMMWDPDAFFDFVRTAPGIVAVEAKRLAEEDAKATGKESS
jgi:hypothetical protein